MDAAIAKARASLGSFIQRLDHPQPREVFSIEAGIAAPDGSKERLWIDDVKYAVGEFAGTLRDKPAKALSVKQHDQVSVKRDDVTDWLILTSGRAEGGYTIDVLMKREGEPR